MSEEWIIWNGHEQNRDGLALNHAECFHEIAKLGKPVPPNVFPVLSYEK